MTLVKLTKEKIKSVTPLISDRDIIRSAIIAELDATSLYETQIHNLHNEKAKNVVRHIMLEEKEHMSELICLLNDIDEEQIDSIIGISNETCIKEHS